MYQILRSPHHGTCASHLTSFEPHTNLVTPILEMEKQAQRLAIVLSVVSGQARGRFQLRFLNLRFTCCTRTSWTRAFCENAASIELGLKAGLVALALGCHHSRAQLGYSWGHSRRHSWSASLKASHVTGMKQRLSPAPCCADRAR